MNTLHKSNKILNLDHSSENEQNNLKQKSDKQNLRIANQDDNYSKLNLSKPIFLRSASQELVIQIDSQKNEKRTLSRIRAKLNEIQKFACFKIIKDNFISNNIDLNQIKNVFCDTDFKVADVLIVSGVIQIVIGVCVILIGLITLANEQKVKIKIILK